ncbi:MAG: hypothetical protein DHS20C15_03220 [Planctomycetota bacterium]|nr:MAG: hypothetical protein DHS20C15_03220 [Planctomycetota bacterium]
MISPRPLRLFAGLIAASAWLAPSSAAQACQDTNDTFWKNDVLTQDFVGTQSPSSVAIAICNTEAVGTSFRATPGAPPQYLKQVSVGFAHTADQTNFAARLSMEIYSGTITWSQTAGPIQSMGTKVFDQKADTGDEFVVTSTGINTFDVRQYNLVLDGDFVVAFRMLENISFPGCPDAIPGTPANFMTDSNNSCTPELNVFDEKFAGWIDPATWQFQFGSPICPQYFGGNFVIRACTTDAGSWTDLGNGLAGSFGIPNLSGSGPLTEGSLNPLVLSDTLPMSSTFVFLGLSSIYLPHKGGVIVPSIDFFFMNLKSNASGGWSLAAPWPGGLPSGLELFWQVWIPDPAAILGVSASNAVMSITP